MLVLTRKVGETVVIGDNIEVSVGRIEGDTVRLRVHAPRHIAIYRGEIYEQMKALNRESATRTRDGMLPATNAVATIRTKVPSVGGESAV